MNKHTLGPWRVGDAGNTVFGPPNGRPSPQTICNLSIVDHVANGRLIAAAPEMLGALLKIESCLAPEDNDGAAKAVRAAIAKATAP